MSLGHWVVREREKYKWSWEEMAKATGVSVGTLRHHAGDPDAEPGVDTIFTIAEHIKVTPWEFMEALGYDTKVLSRQLDPDAMLDAWLLRQSQAPDVPGVIGTEAAELRDDIKALVAARVRRRQRNSQ